MNTALIVIAFILVAVIASALAAIAVFLRQRKEPVFHVTFPAIPQAEPVKVEFSQFPEIRVPTINVPKPDAVKVEFSAFPEVRFEPHFSIPKPDAVTVEFSAFPTVRVDLPEIHVPKVEIPPLPPASVIVTHGVPGQSQSGNVYQMHAPMNDEEVEILNISVSPYRIIGRRPLDHPDLAEARRDPKLAIRYSNGDIDDGSGRKPS